MLMGVLENDGDAASVDPEAGMAALVTLELGLD